MATFGGGGGEEEEEEEEEIKTLQKQMTDELSNTFNVFTV
jgi:hypothetical protein